MTDKAQKLGRQSLRLIEYGGLIIITIATLISSIQELVSMTAAGKVTLADLLMLFIYLEVIAMVAVYLDSGKLPVRMPLYIAIVALARYLALDIKHIDSWEIIAVAGAILILAISTLVIRFGKQCFPNPPGDRSPDRENQNTHHNEP
jgi:protein PsiE